LHDLQEGGQRGDERRPPGCLRGRQIGERANGAGRARTSEGAEARALNRYGVIGAP